MKTYSMDAIRNIAVMGHGKCGKTTLTEAMLFNAKMTDRMGKVADGNTVTDYFNRSCNGRVERYEIQYDRYTGLF